MTDAINISVAIGRGCIYIWLLYLGLCNVLRGHRQWSEVAVSTSRDRCGRLPPDRWWLPAVTGVMIQFDVYS